MLRTNSPWGKKTTVTQTKPSFKSYCLYQVCTWCHLCMSPQLITHSNHSLSLCPLCTLVSHQNLKCSAVIRCSAKPTFTPFYLPPHPGCWPSSSIPTRRIPSQEASQLRASFPSATISVRLLMNPSSKFQNATQCTDFQLKMKSHILHNGTCNYFL